jgi:CubicO group peptidase (beta-lactamase class C family)
MPVAPAGAVWSSIHDMASYFAMHLREGESVEGVQLFPRDELLETHAVAMRRPSR